MITRSSKPPRYTIVVTDLEIGEAFRHENVEGAILITGKTKNKSLGAPTDKMLETGTAIHGSHHVILPIVLDWSELGDQIRQSITKSLIADMANDQSNLPDILKKALGLD